MSAYTSTIQKMYVAFFNRPADFNGLLNWEAYAAGKSEAALVSAIAKEFAKAAEYTIVFKGMEYSQIVTKIYNNLLNRDPDISGLTNWVNHLVKGESTIDSLVTDILTVAGADDLKTINNKVTAATAFTNALDTVAEANAYSGAAANAVAAAWLAAVGTDASLAAATTTAALTAVTSGVLSNSGNAVGQTFTLTTGTDVLTGTALDDTFVASSGTGATLGLSDQINGGAGIDTLKIFSDSTVTLPNGMTNIEKVYINDNAHQSYDISTVSGVTSLELDGGTAVAAAAAADITVTLSAQQSLKLKGITDFSGATADVANQEGVDIATAAGITGVSLALENVGAQTALSANNDLDLDITGVSVTTLNVSTAGINNISLANAGAALTTVNVSGTGSLTVQGTTAATITTFNAAAATGAVTVDLSASTGANQTITGGSGNDTLTVDLQRNITLDAGAGDDVVVLANPTAANLSSTTGSADSINGGTGTDTLVLTAAGAAALAGDTAADLAVLAGFDRLRISDDLNATTFDLTPFNTANKNAINYVQIGAATTTAAATINGFASDATIEFRAGAAVGASIGVNVGMTGATGAGTPNDKLTIALNDNLVDQAAAANSIEVTVGVAGINKLNVTTADRVNTDGATTRDDGYTLKLTSDNNVDTITVTGTHELSFTSTASTAALGIVDASALTGDLILNLATNGLTQGVLVKGGAGTNNVTATAFGDVITGGARADVINAGAGADKVTGGAGADTFQFVAGDSGLPAATNFDEITDFAKGSDIIDFTAGNLVIVSGSTASAGTAGVNAQGIATFNAADDTLAKKIVAAEAGINASGTAAARQFVVFEDAGSSYVFVSDGTDGVGANDVLIKLTGVAGLTTSTLTGGDLILS